MQLDTGSIPYMVLMRVLLCTDVEDLQVPMGSVCDMQHYRGSFKRHYVLGPSIASLARWIISGQSPWTTWALLETILPNPSDSPSKNLKHDLNKLLKIALLDFYKREYLNASSYIQFNKVQSILMNFKKWVWMAFILAVLSKNDQSHHM